MTNIAAIKPPPGSKRSAFRKPVSCLEKVSRFIRVYLGFRESAVDFS